MQQRVLLREAEGSDQTTDGLPHGVAARPQRPIIPHCVPRQVDAACFEKFQLEQSALDLSRCELISDTLQHFAENHIYQPEALTIEFCMNPICLRISYALKVINPDGRVDDHHDAISLRGPHEKHRDPLPRPPYRASGRRCAAPASGSADQSLFGNGPLGSGPAAPHGLPHKSIVDIDVGSHQSRA